MFKKFLTLILCCSFFIASVGTSLAADATEYSDEYIQQLKHNILYSEDEALVAISKEILYEYTDRLAREMAEDEMRKAQERSTGASYRHLREERITDYKVLTGKVIAILGKSQEYTLTEEDTITFSAASLSVENEYTFNVAHTTSVSYHYGGITGQYILPGTSINATNCMHIVVLSGIVYRDVYGVFNSNGQQVSTYYKYKIVSEDVTPYGIFVHTNASNLFYAENYAASKTKNFVTQSQYRSKLESSRVKEAYDW